MLLLNGGNMVFNIIKKLKEENKKLKEKNIELEVEAFKLRKKCESQGSFLSYETAAHKAAIKTIEEYKEELIKSKKEAADATSLYYDTIQKLKTVMEETNYGKDL
jgi:hypothetical protein